MVTKAMVIQTEGKIAIVETKRLSACDGCHKQLEGESCSVCSLMGGNTTLTSRADNSIGAQVGDTVEIGGLVGSAPVMPVHTESSADFIARGGRIPAPMQSLKN